MYGNSGGQTISRQESSWLWSQEKLVRRSERIIMATNQRISRVSLMAVQEGVFTSRTRRGHWSELFTEQENEFVRAFHDCSLGKFQHKDHIQLAWLVLKRHDFAQSHRVISDGLRRFASNQGVPGRYHETLTTFWVGLVDHAIQQAPDTDDFETFL